ncbi:MAG: hypothetical protein GXP38_00335 [Chloroflexi bacterium]|nr:hypothetical protein [Chloroflexota bacterium]
MEDLDVDLVRLQAFERQLDPLHPEASQIPARVLGYGEISTVFAIGDDDLAYKRMPIFRNQAEIDRYEVIYDEYNRLLQEEIGIHLPAHSRVRVRSGEDGGEVLFLVQERLPAASIGNQALLWLGHDDILRLVHGVLEELLKVWVFNKRQEQIEVGIDGQISNWAIADFKPTHPILPSDFELIYIDTSTPLFRVAGEEQLEAELFLRSAPSFLAWLLRLLFLDDVIGRYYDFRRVVIDLIANFYKEQQAELIPELVSLANTFFAQQAADLSLEPITQKDVASYYREDALIWRLYQGARRLDRWLHTRILHKPYPYILPGPVKR